MFKNRFEKWFTIFGGLFGLFSGLIDPNFGVLDDILIAFFYAFTFFIVAKIINAIILIVKKKKKSKKSRKRQGPTR